MGKLIAILFTIFLFTTNAVSQDHKDNDWSTIFRLKNNLKHMIIDVAKLNADNNLRENVNITQLMTHYVFNLSEMRKTYPFEFNLVATKGEPDGFDIATTIDIKYRDDLSEITWTFNTFFFLKQIDFFVATDDGSKEQKTINDFYNFLTLKRG